MDKLSCRDMLVATAAGGLITAAASAQAATFGNPDEPPQGAVNTLNNPSSTTVIGPNNPAISGQFPSALSPPATVVGGLPMFWASFNNAPRRIQDGGWARQVTQFDFQISETIAGVNMRLTRGGIREITGTWRPSGPSSPRAFAA
jgi:oxalate decarboxylase